MLLQGEETPERFQLTAPADDVADGSTFRFSANPPNPPELMQALLEAGAPLAPLSAEARART